MKYRYNIRAHHGMCMAFFVGKGYSDSFTKNMAKVKAELENNPLICVTSSADEICNECPNNNDGICITAEKVAEYDRQVLARCNIVDGEVMPYMEFRKLVYDNILYQGKRKKICSNCKWNELCN